VVAEGEGVTLLTAQLDSSLIALPDEPRPTAGVEPVPVPAPLPDTERSVPMNSKPETNGRPHSEEIPDPLAFAEDLRESLAEAASKASRLVAVLRHTRKEKKALANVLTSLRQLNLGTGAP
jgi:hypothetical protein